MRTMMRCVVLLLTVFITFGVCAEECGWEWVNTSPPRVDILRLNHELGAFVGVGRSGTVIRSTDGYSWSRHDSGVEGDLFGVDWAAGRWVVVGEGVILTSPTALDWTVASEHPGVTFRDIDYSVARFVAVGEGLDGAIAISALGLDWELVDVPWSGAANSVVGTGSGFFVAVGREIWFSSDGYEWELRSTVPTSADFDARRAPTKRIGADLFELDRIDLAYTGSRLFWSGGSELWAAKSSGMNWELAETLSACSPWEDWLGLAAGPGWIVASGISGCPSPYLTPTVTILVSVDGGATFSPPWETALGGFPALARFGSRWIAAGAYGDVLVSNDAATWDCVGVNCSSLGCADDFVDLTQRDGMWMAAGGVGSCDDLIKSHWGATIATTHDGADWEVVALSGDRFRGVTATDAGYLAVGEGWISRSADGETWIDEEAPDNAALYDAVSGQGWVVLVGQSGAIYVSDDEENWAKIFNYSEGDLDRVMFDGERFLALGHNGTILGSSNTTHWNRMLVGSDADLKGAAMGPDKWIAVGEGGTVLASDTGEIWVARRSGVDSHLRDVAWGDGQWVAVGWNEATDDYSPGVILASLEGVHWTRFDAPGEGLQRVAWTGESWIAVGGDRSILASGCLGTLISPDLEHIQVPMGDTVELEIRLSRPVETDTTIGLTSSRPGRVGVPDSVTVAADSTLAAVPVSGLEVVEGAVVTIELPMNIGGGTTTVLASVQPPEWTPRRPGGRVTP